MKKFTQTVLGQFATDEEIEAAAAQLKDCDVIEIRVNGTLRERRTQTAAGEKMIKAGYVGTQVAHCLLASALGAMSYGEVIGINAVKVAEPVGAR